MSSGEPFYFAHRLPRRTRLKVPKRRRDTAFFAGMERRLGALSGVVAVSVTPEAASIVVHHTPDFDWSSVRFEAMGLSPADRRSKCTCTCPRCSADTSNELDLAMAMVWVLKSACTGQILVQLAELMATTAIQSALDDLLETNAARA